MLKPLTLSLSLVVALGASSVSMAGLFDKHHSGVMASPQGVIASPQEIMPSAQCDTGGCEPADAAMPAPKKKCNLFGFLHRPKSYSYTWVLKKKRIRGHKGGDCGGGAAAVIPATTGARLSVGPVCQPAGLRQRPVLRLVADLRQRPGLLGGPAARPTARARPGLACRRPGHQPRRRPRPAGQLTPAPAGDEAPPAPEVPAPAAPTPAAPEAPAAPAAPEAPAPNAPQSSLLFSTPSGN